MFEALIRACSRGTSKITAQT